MSLISLSALGGSLIFLNFIRLRRKGVKNDQNLLKSNFVMLKFKKLTGLNLKNSRYFPRQRAEDLYKQQPKIVIF